MFALVRFRARKGLAEPAPEEQESAAALAARRAARGTGIRGETYAYWYLRRQGYILVAKNYTFPGVKGELDMVGYDGATLAFVEVKTRVMRDAAAARAGLEQRLPEEAVNWEKRRNLSRMASQFLRTRRLQAAPYRFDILAIEARVGSEPQVRLHKGAFRG